MWRRFKSPFQYSMLGDIAEEGREFEFVLLKHLMDKEKFIQISNLGHLWYWNILWVPLHCACKYMYVPNIWTYCEGVLNSEHSYCEIIYEILVPNCSYKNSLLQTRNRIKSFCFLSFLFRFKRRMSGKYSEFGYLYSLRYIN